LAMCRVLRVHRSGFYAWLRRPISNRSKEDQRLLELVRESYIASDKSYGSPRVHLDLREIGERCGVKRVARLMIADGLKAHRSYKRPCYTAGKPSIVAPNRLKQVFTVKTQNEAWVTDITYIRTYEGWLYLAVVIDLLSRMVVGWSMKSTLARGLALDALLMAVWRRRPKSSAAEATVTITLWPSLSLAA
jgi:putative transposase